LPIGVTGISVKELVEMIESRIPAGRYVITILIYLLILTTATASGIYVYHALVLPVFVGISSLLTTGSATLPTITSIISSAMVSVGLYVTFRYSANLVLASNKIIMADYKKVDESLGVLLANQKAIGQRLETIEARVSDIENQGH
jgi:type II secretory pathway component PulF